MTINNRKYLKTFRKNLRNNSTSAEATLWTYLKKSQLGRKFRRQHSIGNFITDFYCPSEKLVVELDGKDHFTSAGYEHDIKKDDYLNKLNIKVLHFENQEIFKNLENILVIIKQELNLNKNICLPPPAPPEPGGERLINNPGRFVNIIFILVFLFSSCSDWLDVNKDPNNPDQANEKLTLASGISSVAYVYGGRYQVLGALWSQHWTQSPGASQYTGLDSYDINSSTYDNQYSELYSGALKNFEYIKELSYSKQNWGYYLIATVMQCYTFQLLADLYDEIPFSEALKGDMEISNPHFEKGQDIYDSLIIRLNFALSRNFDLETVEEVGDEDLLFAGDLELWKQFANTLKLKLYLRQVYIRPEVAENGIRALYENRNIKFITSDVAMNQFVNETGRSNPLFETEVRSFGNNPNLIMSYTLFSYLNENGDLDRLDAMFDYPQQGGGHEALIQGDYKNSEIPTGTNSSSYSKPIFYSNYPVFLMSESEARFLQAEAIVRYGVKPYSEAKEMYENAIEASFLRLLLSNELNENDIVSKAEDFYKQGSVYEFPSDGSPADEFVKSIAVQKWISLAGIQSIETFLEQNRTHYPKISAVPASDESNYKPGELTVSVNNVTSGKLPKRLLFPESEISTNPNIPDKVVHVDDRIWWDVKVDEEMK